MGIPPYRIDRAPAHDRTRAAAEAYVPSVSARRHLVEEQPLFVRPNPLDAQIRLDRILIEEVLRRLHDADARLAKERHRTAQKLPIGHEVRIEDRDELAVGNLQAMIQIAGLSVQIVRPRDIDGALFSAVFLEPGPPLVVKNVNLELVIGIIERERSDDAPFKHVDRLVIGWNKDIDGRPLVRG